MTREGLREAASFLTPELRRILVRTPEGPPGGVFPVRQVALLWCDISGFSRETGTLLAERPDGVEELHRRLQRHYEDLLTLVYARGGEPVTFVGDGLLSVWEVRDNDFAPALTAALGTAGALLRRRREGSGRFDLNLHVVRGAMQTVELGGRHGRWHGTAIGSAMKDLQRIAVIRSPNAVIIDTAAADCLGSAIVTEPVEDPVTGQAARRLCGTPAPHGTGPDPLPGIAATGAGLTVPGIEAWAALSARIPPYVARWVETLGLQWFAELRPVTAMTIALHDIEEDGAADRLDAAVQAIQDVIHARDGSVSGVVVDEKGATVVVTFGTPPDAHSDDPLRCVLSARDIVGALGERGVAASIGIATGRTFCGIVGTPDRRSLVVLGDVMTLSSRLAWAAPRGVLVDQATMRATAATLAFEAAPVSLSLRGRSDPVPAWPLTGTGLRRDMSHATAGRGAEVALLRRLWSDTVTRGEAAAMVIEGDSGMGKTSLALDLAQAVEAVQGRFRIETAVSIERRTPYGALRRLIGEALGVTPGMALPDRRREILQRLAGPLAGRAPLIDAVFPTGIGETAATRDLTGQARAAALEDLLRDVLRMAFAERPLCLSIDDAHWLDPASLRLLLHLREGLPRFLLLILVQKREEADWLDGLLADGTRHIRLQPLTRDGLADLVRGRLGAAEVSGALIDRIAETTSGHPFFSAELVATLQAEDRISVTDGCAGLAEEEGRDPLVLPASLHGMVLQLLDRPDPLAQLSLRIGSVAGMNFPTRIVSDLHPLDDSRAEVPRRLYALARMGLLEPKAVGDRPGYGFTQGILREVAYSQLPFEQRNGLHARAAAWIEANSGASRGSRLLELAHHWTAAGAAEPAVDALLEESLRLFRTGFAVEAVQVGLRAIRVAGEKPPKGEAALQEATGRALATVESLTTGIAPGDLLAGLGPASPALALKFRAILATAPFAFQSGQFPMFAWAAATAMRLAVENRAGPPHAFSMYSVITAALTGDRVRAAAWSRAALDLDALTGGAALPAVGFIDTWFHGHWRDPLSDSIERNRAAAARALRDGDGQYASYNISGEVVLRAALSEPLPGLIAACDAALRQPLHRNSRVHVLMERQAARALQGRTHGPTALSDAEIDEARDIGWVMGSEFANQIGYYLSTRIRLHRHAGDWRGAVALAGQLEPFAAAIAGQTAEVDATFHSLLARLTLSLEGAGADPAIDRDLARLAGWRAIHPGNFGVKADLVEALAQGVRGDRQAGADRLARLAADPRAAGAPQDHALALEHAALLAGGGPYRDAAIAAHAAWGATAVAARLSAAK